MKNIALIFSVLIILGCSDEGIRTFFDDNNDNGIVYIDGFALGSRILEIEVDNITINACSEPNAGAGMPAPYECYGSWRETNTFDVISAEVIIVDESFTRKDPAIYNYVTESAPGNQLVLYKFIVQKNNVDGPEFDILITTPYIGYNYYGQEATGILTGFQDNDKNTYPNNIDYISHYSLIIF